MNPIPLSSKRFQRIIQFYLFECPVRTYERTKKPELIKTEDQPDPKYSYEFKKVSKRGITFADRNLDGARLNSFRAAMLRVTDVKLIAVKTIQDVVAVAEKESGEYIVIKKNDENVSITEGYFYCIRNAFAHGDFDVKGSTYTFKNETKGTIKGLARLKEDSLLAWIDLAEMDFEDIRKAGK